MLANERMKLSKISNNDNVIYGPRESGYYLYYLDTHCILPGKEKDYRFEGMLHRQCLSSQT